MIGGLAANLNPTKTLPNDTFVPWTSPKNAVHEMVRGAGIPRRGQEKSAEKISLPESFSVNWGFCSAALQSGCRTGLQTRTCRFWRLGSPQNSRLETDVTICG